MSLKRLLWIIILTLSLLPIVCFGVLTIIAATGGVRQQGRDALLTLAHVSANNFEYNIHSQDREMHLMLRFKRLQTCLKQSYDGVLVEENISECNRALSEWVEVEENYYSAFLLDEKGTVISCSDKQYLGLEFGSKSWFLKAMSDDAIQVSYVEKSQIHPDIDVIVLSCSMEYEGVKGVLVLEATLDFYKRIVESNVIEGSGISFIIDENDNVICHTDMTNTADTEYRGPRASQILEEYRNGERAETGLEEFEYQGTKRIMAYCVIDKVNWVYITRQMVSEMEAPVTKVHNIMLAALMITALGAVLTSGIMIRKFTKPLKVLQKSFETARKEKRYVVCGLEGNNEFAELAKGYNDMIEVLYANFEETNQLNHEIIVKDAELRRNYELLLEEQTKTEKLAFYDQVTGLPSRAAFEKRLEYLLFSDVPGGVLYLDLDGFKAVNDIFGHPAGDKCLIEIARRLSNPEWKVDIVSRIGGDEYFLIKLGSKEEIETLAKEINRAIDENIALYDSAVHLTCSIGIALFPQDGEMATTIMKNADVAMYDAKDNGKNTYCFYAAAMAERLERQMDILQILQDAIEEQNVYAVCQPELDLRTGRIHGLETLMRLKSGKLGFIGPDEFIPIAESSGLIVSLGNWILRQACIFARTLLEEGKDLQVVAVNVSSVQLELEEFVDDVLFILEETGLAPKHLQLEITESIFMTHFEENIKKLSRLREKGITIALDDFGTGFSSMSYLFELPIDVLKIDKSFVDELTVNQKKQGICQAIIEMAHTLGIDVIAEGIEEAKQQEMLTQMGCDLMQGYLYSRPLPEPELTEFYRIKEEH